MLYNKHNLAVAKIASKSETRPELTGVFFTPKLTCATDSFRLVEVSVDSSVKVQDYPLLQNKSKVLHNCPPFIVPAKELAKIKLPSDKNTSLPILANVAIASVSPQQVQLVTTNLETSEAKSIRRIEGRFPDYEKIFPQGKPVAEIAINGDFLASILAVITPLGRQIKSVKIKFYGNGQPLCLEAGNSNQRARGLIMPLRE